jgi:antitoxin component of MazEF toxin-antitoxin module
MEETIVRARKLGGSLVVTIPKEIAMQEGIVEGEAVKLRIKKVRKDWFGAFKGLGPFTKEDELDEQIRS